MKSVKKVLFWATLHSSSAKLITAVTGIVIANLLSPSEFGAASIVLLMFVFLISMGDLGLGDALMKDKTTDPSEVRTAMLVMIFFNGLIGAIFLLGFLSGALAINEELGMNLMIAVVVLALVTPLNGFIAFQEFHYRSKLNYKSLSLKTIVASVLSSALAIMCALWGLGALSLVAQSIALVLVSTVFFMIYPSLPIVGSLAVIRRSVFSFAGKIFVSRLVEFLGSRYIDILIINAFGFYQYGLYAVSTRLQTLVLQFVHGVINDTTVPLLTHSRFDTDQIACRYITTTRMAAYYISPIFILLSNTCGQWLTVIIGIRWEPAVEFCEILFLLGALQSVQYLNGPFLTAAGYPGWVTSVVISKNIVIIAVLMLLPQESALDYLYALVVTQMTATVPMYVLCVIKLSTKKYSIVSHILKIFCVTICFAIACAIINHVLSQQEASGLLVVLLQGGFCAFFIATCAILSGDFMLLSQPPK